MSEFTPLKNCAPIVERITGDRPSLGAIYRWRANGISGVKLRTMYAMGSHRTTEAWLREFFDDVATAKATTGFIQKKRTTAQQRASDAVNDRFAEILEAAGM